MPRDGLPFTRKISLRIVDCTAVVQKRQCAKSGGIQTLRMLNFPECDFWPVSSGVRPRPTFRVSRHSQLFSSRGLR